ncbi:MAG: YqgE/AlgH family protein [Chitinophagia bacterium]|jgi:putative transcriptional regulator|nr:YqgE/AlgH family protein [Chitinophagia bacterium]
MMEISQGILLVAEPFMKDPNFQRTVVLICDHNSNGSFGITINRLTKDVLGDYLPDFEQLKNPVFDGGPVGKDHMHFIHTRADLIEGGKEIAEGIFWGGDFKSALKLVLHNEIAQHEIRFYLGYAGWEEKQLDGEMDEKSWLLLKANSSLIFHKNPSQIWKDSIKQMGKEFYPVMNYPLDPSYN